MARPHTAMRKIRDVLRLHFDQQLSVRQIAASLGVPRATVSDYLRRAASAGLDGPVPDEVDDLALEALLFASRAATQTSRPVPDWQKVQSELRRGHVTLMLLWHEYKESFPDGYGYSQFCELYRAWHRQVDVVMRQHHKAGEKLFVDFAGRGIPIYDERSGQVSFFAELFVAALGASGYLYAEATRSQELLYWVSAHVHAFEALGGCPAVVVCDNLRSGVTRSHRYEPDLNATYQEMARHYNVAIIPARPYKPRDKSKAEGGVLLAERWIMARLRNERFVSLGEANLAIAPLVGWINARPFKKLDGSRRSVFEELDAPALRPLPAIAYEFATWRTAKVNIDYHIEVRSDRHYYSVPYSLVGASVQVRCSARTVEVFASNRRVASHVRVHAPGFSTDPAHMPESHRRHAEWTPSRIIAWAAQTGPHTARLVTEIMEARPHPEQGFRTCLGIMRLARSFGADRLEAAAARALSVRALSFRSIESILDNGLDKAPLADNAPQRSHPPHDNLRGPEYYQ